MFDLSGAVSCLIEKRTLYYLLFLLVCGNSRTLQSVSEFSDAAYTHIHVWWALIGRLSQEQCIAVSRRVSDGAG